MGLLVYLIVKLVAYFAVCVAGLKRFGDGLPSPGRALALAVGRLVLGLGLGLFIYSWTNAVYGALEESYWREVLTYLAVSVPTRWVEWSILALFIVPASRRPLGFLIGSSGADRLWRLAGIAVSCLADVPVFIELGGL